MCACGFFPRELHIFLDTGYGFLSLATLLHLEMECGWLRVVRDQRREATREGATAAHSHTHTLSVGPHDTDSTFLGHAPRSEHVYGRAREACLYAATQPLGHLAMIGSEPKSSWRRWRALTETQPTGQSLMDAPLRKSQASWVVSNGAPPRSS